MRRPGWRRIAWKIFRVVAGVYLGAIILAFVFQRRLIYQPTRSSFETGAKAAAAQGFEAWRNNSGDYIGWKTATGTNRFPRRLLIVHGNAGSAINRVGYADSLQKFFSAEVFVLEYPGYGARPGSPSQKSFFAAADEALAMMTNGGPVYLMGESLGTGVAAYLAGTRADAIAGVLLIAPYNNLTDVAANHFPFLPVRWLLWDKYPSANYLVNYHGPVAVLLAGRDTTVPNQFGHKLYDAYPGPKKLWVIPDAEHNDLPEEPEAWWRELAEFWKQNAK